MLHSATVRPRRGLASSFQGIITWVFGWRGGRVIILRLASKPVNLLIFSLALFTSFFLAYSFTFSSHRDSLLSLRLLAFLSLSVLLLRSFPDLSTLIYISLPLASSLTRSLYPFQMGQLVIVKKFRAIFLGDKNESLASAELYVIDVAETWCAVVRVCVRVKYIICRWIYMRMNEISFPLVNMFCRCLMGGSQKVVIIGIQNLYESLRY